MFRRTCLIIVCVWVAVSARGETQALNSVASLSGDLLALLTAGDQRVVRVIVRGDVQAIQQAATRDRLRVARVLDGFVVLEGPLADVTALRSLAGVEAISRDARVMPFMSVSAKTMAADQARLASPGLLGLGGYPAVTGRGVGVAVIDSGIASHPALTGKVVAAVSFVTGDTSTNDAYGHGTHIAGIIAGNFTRVTPLYQGGIAPGAHLVNVRVLGADGAGYTSDVIAGIQWTVANSSRYGIRVVNLRGVQVGQFGVVFGVFGDPLPGQRLDRRQRQGLPQFVVRFAEEAAHVVLGRGEHGPTIVRSVDLGLFTRHTTDALQPESP